MSVGYPVSYSDDQFHAVTDAAKLLPPHLRSKFLTAVTNRLATAKDPRILVDDASVARAINLALRDLEAVG